MRSFVAGVAVFTLLTTVAHGSSVTSDRACWSRQEVEAAHVRNLQTLLMVAAYECGDGAPAENYNVFVRQHRGAIAGFNDTLKTYFYRNLGLIEGRHAYDRFTTALANAQSSQAIDAADFCGSADVLVKLAYEADREELVGLASMIGERPLGVGPDCAAADPARAAIAGLQPVPRRALARPAFDEVAEAAEADAGSDAPVATGVAELAVAAPETAVPPIAEPVVVAAVPAPVAAAAAPPPRARPTTAQALALAVSALETAAEALKAAAAEEAAQAPGDTIDGPPGDVEPLPREAVPSAGRAIS